MRRSVDSDAASGMSRGSVFVCIEFVLIAAAAVLFNRSRIVDSDAAAGMSRASVFVLVSIEFVLVVIVENSVFRLAESG